MICYHATPVSNMASIRDHGLLCSKSKGKRMAVWLHTASKTAWAMLHTVARHAGSIEDVAVLTVDVPDRWLRRHSRGLWYCCDDVPPARIISVRTFQTVAQSTVA